MKPLSAKSTDRRYEAIQLRREGKSYRDISAALGCSVSTAFSDVQKELQEVRKKTREDAETVRDIELERLDLMLKALFPKAQAGDTKAACTILKIMDRRAKYLGLDAQEVININDLHHAERMEEMQRVREKIDAAILADPENRERIASAFSDTENPIRSLDK